MRIDEAVSKVARHRLVSDIAAMHIEAVGEMIVIQERLLVALVRQGDDERQRRVGKRQRRGID